VPTTLLSWNLKDDERALARLLTYAKRLQTRGSNYIIAIQEGLNDAAWWQARLNGATAIGNGSQVILTNHPIAVHAGYAQSEYARLVVGRVQVNGVTTTVANYHGPYRGLPEQVARGGWVSEFRYVLDQLAGNSELLILGDFNSEPHSEEVSHSACFMIRKSAPAGRELRSHNRPRVDLRLLAPQVGIGATHYYKPYGMETVGVVYDFMAATPAIAGSVSRVESLRGLEGNLAGENGQPAVSDHFPVRAIWSQ
jgi:exonuclease III